MHKQNIIPYTYLPKKHQISIMHCSVTVELYSVVHLIFSNIVTVKSKLGKPANRLHICEKTV